MSKAEHLRAHASRLLAFAHRFRHAGHDACAEELATHASQYLYEAATLDVPNVQKIIAPSERKIIVPNERKIIGRLN